MPAKTQTLPPQIQRVTFNVADSPWKTHVQIDGRPAFVIAIHLDAGTSVAAMTVECEGSDGQLQRWRLEGNVVVDVTKATLVGGI